MNYGFENINIRPIGIVRSTRTEATDDYWGLVQSVIELDSTQFDEQVLYGLTDFSHCEIVFYMDKVNPERIELSARHPRNNPDYPKVGIFAQRAKGRPNCLGVSRAKIIGVQGLKLTVQALDAIDGTPIIDIKPYMAEFGPQGETHQPVWATELMAHYYDE